MKRLAVAAGFAVLAALSGSALAFADASPTTNATGTVRTVPMATLTGQPETTTTTTLSGSGAKVVFTPSRLTGVPVVVSTSDCSTSNYSFSIVNSTGRTQKVLLNGAIVTKILPEQGALVCLDSPGKYTFALRSSSTATLKVVTASSS
jgi:hypothetical protein